MKILLTPFTRFNNEKRFVYTFDNEVIRVKDAKGESDTFDFSGFPDGELVVRDDEGNLQIDTIFETCPILSAKRISGILYVELVNFVEPTSGHTTNYPKWEEVD